MIFALNAAVLAVGRRSGSVCENFCRIFLLRNPLDQGDSRRKMAKIFRISRWAAQGFKSEKHHPTGA
ncbi:hypothetical protein [Campylobacter sp.]|uniref:hypothetical protein n=1 Tax=Campylobacter sp. TaxID=205 RepID=UPI002A87A177|nr:hypothetical protein [Campylobacter sp.]MCI7237531.1 hypothetical protein [Campylobacter sp.]MCI7501664.1 hypothetical protein [Campylobacter sp.]MDY4830325.1 hypothetical protein [Campylobacter sp.]